MMLGSEEDGTYQVYEIDGGEQYMYLNQLETHNLAEAVNFWIQKPYDGIKILQDGEYVEMSDEEIIQTLTELTHDPDDEAGKALSNLEAYLERLKTLFPKEETMTTPANEAVYNQMLGALRITLGELTAENAAERLDAILAHALEIFKAHPEAVVNSAIWDGLRGHANGKMMTPLEAKLHQNCSHPDYQYTSSTRGRKSCADFDQPPGQGWEDNETPGYDNYDGFDRGDNTETQEYRRLKTWMLTDRVDVFGLKPAEMPKLSRTEFFQMFCPNISPFFMSLGTKQPDRTSASAHQNIIHFDHLEQLATLTQGNGIYTPSASFADEAVTPVKVREFFESSAFFTTTMGYSRTPPDDVPVQNALLGHYFWVVEQDNVRILIDLNTTGAYCSTKRKDGQWQPYESWHDYSKLAINKYELEALIKSSTN